MNAQIVEDYTDLTEGSIEERVANTMDAVNDKADEKNHPEILLHLDLQLIFLKAV